MGKSWKGEKISLHAMIHDECHSSRRVHKFLPWLMTRDMRWKVQTEIVTHVLIPCPFFETSSLNDRQAQHTIDRKVEATSFKRNASLSTHFMPTPSYSCVKGVHAKWMEPKHSRKQFKRKKFLTFELFWAAAGGRDKLLLRLCSQIIRKTTNILEAWGKS